MFALARLVGCAALAWCACCPGQFLFAQSAKSTATELKPGYAGAGTLVVAHPAASQQKALAIDLRPKTGKQVLKVSAKQLPAGLYRVAYHLRWHHSDRDDLSRLLVSLQSGGVSRDVMFTQLDSGADRFTPIEVEMLFPEPFIPSPQVTWRQVVFSSTERSRPIRPLETPNAPELKPERKTTAKQAEAVDDLLGELENTDKVASLAEIDYPALLIDRISYEPLSSGQMLSAVRPEFIHIYPGQENPISVTALNLDRHPVAASVELEVRAGLDEVLHTQTQEITLPGGGQPASCTFNWKAGQREFGHEARVTLRAGGRVVHTQSEYFSVSLPIWKTALQASGFLTWLGREQSFPEHVANNRKHYLNVEEAFSWQPSSWIDLTPEGEHWWTGQNDFHNSLSGLRQWIDLSHRQGIKMITYLWPSASGPSGLEWARQYPHLATHEGLGLSTEFADVEDLRLQTVTQEDEKLWDLRSGIWNSVGINRGMLEGIDLGMRETAASAQAFGWDGARFDAPPSWSAMGATGVHAEFKLLGIEKLMRELTPEYYAQREGAWDGEAISIRNLRYARHLLRQHDPRFALSFNFGVDLDEQGFAKPEQGKFFAECCRDGGQIMLEQIRNVTTGPWRNYLDRIRKEVEVTRQRGGYHTIVAPDAGHTLLRTYCPIFMFVGGSHPYLDFGWSHPSPGRYTQFMTRYGEYCWSLDLAPTTAAAEKFELNEERHIWWDDLLKVRELSTGERQWVIHLIAAPPDEEMSPQKPVRMTPWQRELELCRETTAEPVVWALTAEPVTRAVRLQPERSGSKYVVKVPELHCWSTIVWTESASPKK